MKTDIFKNGFEIISSHTYAPLAENGLWVLPSTSVRFWLKKEILKTGFRNIFVHKTVVTSMY